MGFEYRYRFRVDYNIVPQYSSYLSYWQDADFMFLFETRTNFLVKRKFDDDEMIIDSESFATAGWEKVCTERYVELWMGRRLKDYWMSDYEIQELVGNALAFAKKAPRNPGHGLIPIVVDLDVCTIQQEGEPIDATMDRGIKTQCLYPMNLCPYNEASPRKNHRPEDDKLVPHPFLFFLRDRLPTKRVEDDKSMEGIFEYMPISITILCIFPSWLSPQQPIYAYTEINNSAGNSVYWVRETSIPVPFGITNLEQAREQWTSIKAIKVFLGCLHLRLLHVAALFLRVILLRKCFQQSEPF